MKINGPDWSRVVAAACEMNAIAEAGATIDRYSGANIKPVHDAFNEGVRRFEVACEACFPVASPGPQDVGKQGLCHVESMCANPEGIDS